MGAWHKASNWHTPAGVVVAAAHGAAGAVRRRVVVRRRLAIGAGPRRVIVLGRVLRRSAEKGVRTALAT